MLGTPGQQRRSAQRNPRDAAPAHHPLLLPHLPAAPPCRPTLPPVLIDEAGQASEVAALQPLCFGAKRCGQGLPRVAQGWCGAL